MVMAVLLIADLYVMIHMPGKYLMFAIVTILFLVSAYFLGNGILKELQNNKLRAEEQYEAIAKSEKASYILLKKAFEQLEEIEGNSKKPAEDIITAQKAIAKVTISRNKENTDALMNSNDKVLEKIFDFEENLGNNQNDLLDKQRDMIDNSMKALMQQQQEIASNMKAMEESIKNELLQAMSSMQAAQPAETTADLDLGDTELPLDFDLGDTEPALGFDLGDTEPALDLDLGLGVSEPMADFDLGTSESLADIDLGGTGLDDSLGLGEDFNLEEPSIPADIDLGIDLLAEEEPLIEEPEEPIVEEPVTEEPEEPIVEEQVAEEPEEPDSAVEEDTAMPDLSDPHKLMTPEEIAALIAKM